MHKGPYSLNNLCRWSSLASLATPCSTPCHAMPSHPTPIPPLTNRPPNPNAAPNPNAPQQDVVAGDGTTSVVVICGALLKKAQELLAKGVHPTVVSDAFAKAVGKANEVRAAALLCSRRRLRLHRKLLLCLTMNITASGGVLGQRCFRGRLSNRSHPNSSTPNRSPPPPHYRSWSLSPPPWTWATRTPSCAPPTPRCPPRWSRSTAPCCPPWRWTRCSR